MSTYNFVFRDGTEKRWACHELPRIDEWVRDPSGDFEYKVDRIVHPTEWPTPDAWIVQPGGPVAIVQLGVRLRNIDE